MKQTFAGPGNETRKLPRPSHSAAAVINKKCVCFFSSFRIVQTITGEYGAEPEIATEPIRMERQCGNACCCKIHSEPAIWFGWRSTHCLRLLGDYAVPGWPVPKLSMMVMTSPRMLFSVVR